MAKGKVKFRSAYDENGYLVTLTPARKVEGKFTCPNPKCKLEMIPRQGEYNTYHFAHKGKECDYDHYLHTIAELRIKEWYNKAEKVCIKIPNEVVCPNYSSCKFYQEGYGCRRESTDTDDLKKYWPKCEIEKKYEIKGKTFIPDLLCRDKADKGRPLFIEICVTHPCDLSKINTGVRIIEFFIKSEDDIDLLTKRIIAPSDMVVYHNFKISIKLGAREDFCQILNKAVVYENFKAGVNKILCKDIEKRQGLLELTVDSSLDLQELYKYGTSFCIAQALAYKYIPNFRSCYICVNCRKNFGRYICIATSPDFSKLYCKGNDPRTCPNYKPDESIINRRICAFEELSVRFVYKTKVRTNYYFSIVIL